MSVGEAVPAEMVKNSFIIHHMCHHNLQYTQRTNRLPTASRRAANWASFFRRAPLLLTAVLPALLLSFLLIPHPAQADHTVWSATLTVKSESGLWGCNLASCSDALTDGDFRYKGVDYQLRQALSGGGFQFAVDKIFPDSFYTSVTLIIDGRELPLADSHREIWSPDGTASSSGSQVVWYSLNLSWSVGDTISLHLVHKPAQTVPTVDSLPVDYGVEPVPPSQRRPTGTGASASDAYCYLAEGNSATEYVRYPNGRVAETTKASAYIRSLFAC